MKAIIYAGIGLFSVATVYGLADYYSSQKKGTLEKLYAEEEPAVTPIVEEKTTGAIPVKIAEAAPVESETVSVKKTSNKKVKTSAPKEIKMEDYSRARIPESIFEELENAPVEIKTEIKPEKLTVEPGEKTETIEVSERKLSLDKFSRAPLKKPIKKVKVPIKG